MLCGVETKNNHYAIKSYDDSIVHAFLVTSAQAAKFSRGVTVSTVWSPKLLWIMWQREHPCRYRISMAQPVAKLFTDWIIPAIY
jgi:hypothetical protein